MKYQNWSGQKAKKAFYPVGFAESTRDWAAKRRAERQRKEINPPNKDG